MVVAETATTFPAYGLGDAAGIFAIDYLLQPRNDVSVAVLAEFDHDPAAMQFVRDSASCAGASKRIEDQITRI